MVKNEWARCNDHCPVWEKLDCKSYLVVTKEKNYNAAKADCVSMGAKLVVETRFNKRASGVDETKQRISCIAVIHMFTLWSNSSQMSTFNF